MQSQLGQEALGLQKGAPFVWDRGANADGGAKRRPGGVDVLSLESLKKKVTQIV